jgi:hypothetical protein
LFWNKLFGNDNKISSTMAGFLIPTNEQYRFLRQYKKRRRLEGEAAIVREEHGRVTAGGCSKTASIPVLTADRDDGNGSSSNHLTAATTFCATSSSLLRPRMDSPHKEETYLPSEDANHWNSQKRPTLGYVSNNSKNNHDDRHHNITTKIDNGSEGHDDDAPTIAIPSHITGFLELTAMSAVTNATPAAESAVETAEQDLNPSNNRNGSVPSTIRETSPCDLPSSYTETEPQSALVLVEEKSQKQISTPVSQKRSLTTTKNDSPSMHHDDDRFTATHQGPLCSFSIVTSSCKASSTRSLSPIESPIEAMEKQQKQPHHHSSMRIRKPWFQRNKKRKFSQTKLPFFPK